MTRTHAVNFVAVPLSEEVGPTSLTFTFDSTSAFPPAPFYAVVDLADDTRREVIKVSTVTATTLQCANLDDRYLEGSADGSGITHDAEADVLVAAVSQNLGDIWDAIEAIDPDVPGGKNSIEVDDGDFQLVGDADDPGADKVYGTDDAGVKGFHDPPSSGAFTALTDTPADYADEAGKFVRVNAGEDALEFVGVSLGSPAGDGTEVAASQSTTSTSYTDLTTPGPAVTINTGTKALVFLSADIANDTAGHTSRMSVAVSGASSVSPIDARALRYGLSDAGLSASRAVLITGLTAGSNTFTAKYRVSAGSGTFGNRSIIVVPLSS